MRRKEFAVAELEEIEQFLSEVSFGFLGMNSEDGFPRVVPLNFAYGNGVFIFMAAVLEKRWNG